MQNNGTTAWKTPRRCRRQPPSFACGSAALGAKDADLERRARPFAARARLPQSAPTIIPHNPLPQWANTAALHTCKGPTCGSVALGAKDADPGRRARPFAARARLPQLVLAIGFHNRLSQLAPQVGVGGATSGGWDLPGLRPAPAGDTAP